MKPKRWATKVIINLEGLVSDWLRKQDNSCARLRSKVTQNERNNEKKIESLLSENRAKPSFFFLKAKLYRIEYFSPISQRTVT